MKRSEAKKGLVSICIAVNIKKRQAIFSDIDEPCDIEGFYDKQGDELKGEITEDNVGFIIVKINDEAWAVIDYDYFRGGKPQ